MKIIGVKPDTGETFQEDVAEISNDYFQEFSIFEMSDDDIKRMIDRLNISADIKALLYKFSKATLKVGSYILKVGRKIIDYICAAFREYPNTGFGMLFGAIVTLLIASIPVLGALLAPIVGPILIAYGILVGANVDLENKKLKTRVQDIVASFIPLKT